jgi:hypothetical protein
MTLMGDTVTFAIEKAEGETTAEDISNYTGFEGRRPSILGAWFFFMRVV